MKKKHTLRDFSHFSRNQWAAALVLLRGLTDNNWNEHTRRTEYSEVVRTLIGKHKTVNGAIALLEKLLVVLRAAQEAHAQVTK